MIYVFPITEKDKEILFKKLKESIGNDKIQFEDKAFLKEDISKFNISGKSDFVFIIGIYRGDSKYFENLSERMRKFKNEYYLIPIIYFEDKNTKNLRESLKKLNYFSIFIGNKFNNDEKLDITQYVLLLEYLFYSIPLILQDNRFRTSLNFPVTIGISGAMPDYNNIQKFYKDILEIIKEEQVKEKQKLNIILSEFFQIPVEIENKINERFKSIKIKKEEIGFFDEKREDYFEETRKKVLKNVKNIVKETDKINISDLRQTFLKGINSRINKEFEEIKNKLLKEEITLYDVNMAFKNSIDELKVLKEQIRVKIPADEVKTGMEKILEKYNILKEELNRFYEKMEKLTDWIVYIIPGVLIYILGLGYLFRFKHISFTLKISYWSIFVVFLIIASRYIVKNILVSIYRHKQHIANDIFKRFVDDFYNGFISILIDNTKNWFKLLGLRKINYFLYNNNRVIKMILDKLSGLSIEFNTVFRYFATKDSEFINKDINQIKKNIFKIIMDSLSEPNIENIDKNILFFVKNNIPEVFKIKGKLKSEDVNKILENLEKYSFFSGLDERTNIPYVLLVNEDLDVDLTGKTSIQRINWDFKHLILFLSIRRLNG